MYSKPSNSVWSIVDNTSLQGREEGRRGKGRRRGKEREGEDGVEEREGEERKGE